MPLWTGSALVWLVAPLVGVGAINLPFFIYFTTFGGFGPVRLSHLALGLADAVLVAAWCFAVWALAQRHSSRGRDLHVVVACLLAMAGGAAAFFYGHATANRAASIAQFS
jgi:hypothetical protein